MLDRFFGLLIEPVWNRNLLLTEDPDLIPIAFNRTSMESKRFILIWTKSCSKSAFNRTSMESKLRIDVRTKINGLLAFNRTSMESKHFSSLSQSYISISPFNRTSMESKLPTLQVFEKVMTFF